MTNFGSENHGEQPARHHQQNDELRASHESKRGDRPQTPARSAERLSVEHEVTLSLEWETQLGGQEAERVDEALRARDAAAGGSEPDPDDAPELLPDSGRAREAEHPQRNEVDRELELGFDRTLFDPANATLRGVESPLVAPKGGGTARGRERTSDEGLRFSGASMSFGQIVVVERRDYPTDAIPLEGTEPEPPTEANRTATRLLVASGIAAALLSAVIFVVMQ
ncbi:MAG: hypothetical protein RL591_1464 [Planctomycetota bacterium]